MPATPTIPTWSGNLHAIAEYVETHAGRFPPNRSDDPQVAALAAWWAQQNSAENRDRLDPYDLDQLDALREHADRLRTGGSWDEHLLAIAVYVETHAGRFPPNRSDDPATAELGCWWVAQNIALNRQRMDDTRRGRLDALRAEAARLRAQEKQRRAAANAVAAKTRARAATVAAGRAGAVAARRALKSPHLVPGDAEILQLRIDHPDLSLAELAELAGTTPGRFATKYYGALRRGPNSRTPLPKQFPDRLLTPGEAAAELGVSRAVLARWVEAGLVAAERKGRSRRYRGSEVLRVKEVIAGGLPDAYRHAQNTQQSHAA